jgi:hypothetical protein
LPRVKEVLCTLPPPHTSTFFISHEARNEVYKSPAPSPHFFRLHLASGCKFLVFNQQVPNVPHRQLRVI